MKKLLSLSILLLIFCVLVGCASTPSNADSQLQDTDSTQINYEIKQKEMFQFNDMQIEYMQGTFFDKQWDNPVGTYQGDAIPDKIVAVTVASAIFDGKAKSPEQEKYIPTSVFYDEQDNVWIVHFGNKINETDQGLMLGGGVSIALRKNDGAVLRIWAGE